MNTHDQRTFNIQLFTSNSNVLLNTRIRSFGLALLIPFNITLWGDPSYSQQGAGTQLLVHSVDKPTLKLRRNGIEVSIIVIIGTPYIVSTDTQFTFHFDVTVFGIAIGKPALRLNHFFFLRPTITLRLKSREEKVSKFSLCDSFSKIIAHKGSLHIYGRPNRTWVGQESTVEEKTNCYTAPDWGWSRSGHRHNHSFHTPTRPIFSSSLWRGWV